MSLIDIKVPDIGDFKDVPVIEIFVKPGDKVKAEDPLVALESDKATMEVPSPRDGVVKSVVVNVGDKVSEGAVIVQFERAGAEQPETRPVVSAPPSPISAPSGVAEVCVPDIGDFKDVPVIEIFVKPGDTVKAEDPLIALESDKATMEVPAPLSGIVREIRLKTGARSTRARSSSCSRPATRRQRPVLPPQRPRQQRLHPPRLLRRQPGRSTRRPLRSPMPGLPCASWRANSVPISARSRDQAITAASCARTSRPS